MNYSSFAMMLPYLEQTVVYNACNLMVCPDTGHGFAELPISPLTTLSGAISEITVGLRCPLSSPILEAFGWNPERTSRMDSQHVWPLTS